MSEETPKTPSKTELAKRAFTKERNSFKALLVTNPNYFGNLVTSNFPAVLPILGNTFYEDLGCVGYHPQQQKLEAVVYINQPSGYGTDICGPGTPEYVRFYLSYDNGVTWDDQGVTSFQAHNIPEGTEGTKRLEYAVSLPVDPARKFCFFDPLIKVRAILSWNNVPPADTPNWNPIWGRVRDATILVEPFRFFFPDQIFDFAKAKVPFKEIIDLQAKIPAKVKALGAVELAKLYKSKGVPVHRFAFKELKAFTASTTTLSAEKFLESLPGVQFDPGILDALFPTDGNTSFEELKCIGLDPNSPDTLVGIIQLKLPNGFSGGPCTDGSREYVTWWADFDGDGSFEALLGTSDVRVYDLTNIPPDGVHVAVRLPVDLNPYRQACAAGPKVVGIRAILSWNSAPPGADPDHVPVWGNREETLIHIGPVAGAPAGKIAILGGIPVSHIDNLSGLTTATAVFATNNLPPDSLGRPCPFGARVTVQGSPLLGHTYKVEVIPVGGGAPTPVVTDLVLTRFDGTTFTHTANPITHRFAYVDFTQNVNSVLAQWDTTGDALWDVILSTYDPGGILVGTDTHRIQLDNTWPVASIEITSGLGDCGKFTVGTMLTGDFVATDDYLSSYSLSVEPAVNPAGVGVPSPSSGLVNTAPAPGDAWTLDTTGMRPCGYIIRVVASDRSILNSQSVGHHSPDSSGFCLEPADVVEGEGENQ